MWRNWFSPDCFLLPWGRWGVYPNTLIAPPELCLRNLKNIGNIFVSPIHLVFCLCCKAEYCRHADMQLYWQMELNCIELASESWRRAKVAASKFRQTSIWTVLRYPFCSSICPLFNHICCFRLFMWLLIPQRALTYIYLSWFVYYRNKLVSLLFLWAHLNVFEDCDDPARQHKTDSLLQTSEHLNAMLSFTRLLRILPSESKFFNICWSK